MIPEKNKMSKAAINVCVSLLILEYRLTHVMLITAFLSIFEPSITNSLLKSPFVGAPSPFCSTHVLSQAHPTPSHHHHHHIHHHHHHHHQILIPMFSTLNGKPGFFVPPFPLWVGVSSYRGGGGGGWHFSYLIFSRIIIFAFRNYFILCKILLCIQ